VSFRGSADLESLRGLRDLRCAEDSCTFLYSGELDALLSVLARGQIRDLTVSEPDLEEVFMHYYEDGGEQR